MSDTKLVKDLVEGDVFIFKGVARKIVKTEEDDLLYIEPELNGPLYHDTVVEMVVDPEEEDVPPVDEIQHALDRGFEPGRLWQANDKEGNTLAETTNPKDFRHFGLLDRDDVAIFRLYTRTESEWVKETPEL